MHFAFALAPLVVLALVVLALRSAPQEDPATLREHFLGAILILVTTVVVATELLGAFGAIGPRSIAGFWMTATVLTAALVVRRRRTVAPLRMPALDRGDVALLAGVVLVSLVTLVVAWLAPPQSSDSIGYHMTRVMHWMQNGSLAHYPTADPPQLFEPPLAEILRLHLQLLSGGDRAGCLLQWLAMIASAAGASVVARDLGGARRAQIFAAVLVVTLPIGITQASSGKNGWLESLWLLSLAHFGRAFAAEGTRASQARLLAAFAALGLELATKISAWLFAPPFVLLAIWSGRHALQSGWQRLRGPLLAGTALTCAIAAPYLVRNVSLYGHPLVDPVFREKSGLEHITPATVVSNLVRNAVFQFGTGIEPVDETTTALVRAVHDWIGLDASDPATTQFGPFRIKAPTLVEEKAYSPLHIVLLGATAVALLFSRRLRANGRAGHLIAVLAAYVLYSSAVQWQPPSCRLLMPLLVLAAPLIAVTAADVVRAAIVPAGVVLFAAAMPYVLWIESRPLTFEENSGLLAAPRERLYFRRVEHVRTIYIDVAGEIRRTGAHDVGVVFMSDSEPEYLLWMLLGDQDPPVRIRNVNVRDVSRTVAPPAQPPPDLVVVFAPYEQKPSFDETLMVDGMETRLARQIHWAAIYLPRERGG